MTYTHLDLAASAADKHRLSCLPLARAIFQWEIDRLRTGLDTVIERSADVAPGTYTEYWNGTRVTASNLRRALQGVSERLAEDAA